MAPGGVFIASTSGEDNKPEHRILEGSIAQLLTDESDRLFSPPPVMNKSFTAESAKHELLDEFNYVYKYTYEGDFIVDSVAKYNIYKGSLLSMRNQFNPIPTEEAYEYVVEAIMQDIWDKVGTDEPFIERLSRTAYVCADKPLVLTGAELVEKIDS